MFDWLFKSLSFLGLYKKKANIVFLGLDNAGKSTLLAMLKNSTATQVAPTQHPTSQTLEIGQIKFKTYDLGGHTVARSMWEQYYTSCNGIVYLIDCADASRFSESKEILDELLNNEDLSAIPMLILGNKVDIKSAVSMEELCSYFGITSKLTGKSGSKLINQRPLEVFPCSVITKFGYGEGFKWLSKYI